VDSPLSAQIPSKAWSQSFNSGQCQWLKLTVEEICWWEDMELCFPHTGEEGETPNKYLLRCITMGKKMAIFLKNQFIFFFNYSF